MNTPSSSSERAGRARRGRKVWSGTQHVIAYGMPPLGWRDVYHHALEVNWPTFFALLATMFLALNAVFAGLYSLGDGAIANQSPPGFVGAFFFSVETLATVGYGDMHPQTLYAHVIATLEIFIGMSGIAMATGLVFARFSRPRAKILFARNPVVRTINGKPTLMLRAANARQNVIAEATARLRLMQDERSPEGYSIYKIRDLKLERSEHPIFLLGWVLMHVIDETSPLHNATAASLAAVDTLLLLTIEGADETAAQTVQARYSWRHDAIRWNHRYLDLIHDEDGVTTVDYDNFHKIEPLDERADQA